MNAINETLPVDTAVWLTQGERTLVYDSWNEYREGDPHCREVFRKSNPQGNFCYWCAFDGQTMALETVTDRNGSCIAAVEGALQATGAHSVYVIWQPKNHTPGVWDRWCKKWAVRTALVK